MKRINNKTNRVDILKALTESEALSEEAFDTFDTFEEFKAALKHAGGLYALVGDKAHHMSTELLKEIALDAIYRANADESIINDIKERHYGVYSESSLKEGSEVLRVWDENSKEYKTLQSFVDKLNQASTETEYYLQNLYFDFGQGWKYTAIVAKKGGQEWQAATPKDLEDILINGNEEEVLNKLVSKNG